MVGSATQKPLHCRANIPYTKPNLWFTYISQGIPNIISNAKSNTLKFIYTFQGQIYTKPVEWPIHCNLLPFENLTLTGSTVDTVYPKSLTTNY